MSSSRKSSSSHSGSKSSSSSNHVVAASPNSTRGVSLSQPLLEGLCQRSENAHSIVHDALKKLHAATRIAKWVSAHYRKKEKPSRFVMIPFQQKLPPQQHWLWDAMRSSSRSERHVAARLLLQGGCPCETCRLPGDSTPTASQEEVAQFKLQHVLMALWNRHILPVSTAGGDLSSAVALPSNIPMEWMALLKHVVLGKTVTEERIMAFCLGGIPWITQSIWELVTSLSQSEQQACSPTQLQALIGLVELCYSVLLVVFIEPEITAARTDTTTGSPGTTAASGAVGSAAATSSNSVTTNAAAGTSTSTTRRPSSSRRLNPGSPRLTTASTSTTSRSTPTAASTENKDSESLANSAAATKRLTMRRRVLKRLLWKPVDIGAGAHPHHANNSNNNNITTPLLTPLACLIGALHIWKTNTDWPYPGPTADACLTMLRQLVDPNSTAKAVSLAGLTGSAASGSGATSTTRPRDTPNSTSSSSRQRRRKRQRTTAGSSALGSSPSASPSAFLFRHESRRNASAGSSAGGGSERRRTTAETDATDGTVTRLLSSVLGSAAVRHSSQSDPEDDDEEGEDVVMEDIDDDDDSDGEVDVGMHLHDDHDDDHNELAAEDDEIIESDEAEGNEDDEEDGHDDEEGEDDNDEEDDDEDDEDEDDDDDDEDELGHDDEEQIVLHDDDDVARLEEGLLELNDGAGAMEIDLEDIVGEEASGAGLVMAATSSTVPSRSRSVGASSSNAASAGSSGAAKTAVDSRELVERKRLYLQACMQVLAVQHPPVLSASAALSLVSRAGSLTSSRAASRTASRSGSPVPHFRSHRGSFLSPGTSSAPGAQSAVPRKKCFSLSAEQSLLESAMGIVRPPKKPVNTKMIMRRAPTQEEFFRGSLSRNPISLSMLKPSTGGNSGSGPSSSGDVYEPTVRDLRQHIADDLQMSDSAELLELLVANKILDVNLKLRVVHQVLWKNHLMEHSHAGPASSSSSSALASLLAGSGAGAPSFFSTGSGLSMMFSSGLGGISVGSSRGGGVLSRASGGQAITADTPLAALPPLVVTYRLAGVDGEATEDTVSTLVDPEAPSDAMSPKELEQLLEKEYGITRIVTEGRGVYVLLRSIEHHIQEVLRQIRRDDVSVLMEYGKSRKSSAVGQNKSRSKFKHAPPYPGLALLRCCAKLPSNRSKLLQARAPTILLRLLLDVLNALEDPQAKSSMALETADSGDSGSNETAEILQELIEALASDISSADDSINKSKANAMDESQTDDTASTSDSVAAVAEGQGHDATTLSLVLSSLESISLSPPLRNIIAKLLPFLTYGQIDLSRELALNFARHIDVNALVDIDKDELPDGVIDLEASNEQAKENEEKIESPSRKETSKSSVLMEAFVQASITLPPNEVCHSLRSELINCGFIHRLASFVTRGVPSFPPPWSAALSPKDDANKGSPNKKRQAVINSWRDFFQRQGIKIAFNMLIGLCRSHPQTQAYISQVGEEGDKLSTSNVSFLQALHWLEGTSDSASNRVYVRGVGLLAETLMDELMEENDFVGKKVNALRRATRQRKKEIAEARRSKALLSMSSAYAPLAGAGSANRKSDTAAADASTRSQAGGGVRGTAASLLAPVFGFFQNSTSAEGGGNAEASTSNSTSRSSPRASRKTRAAAEAKEKAAAKKPAWMAEMENLEDEEGLVCSVCQEGRTLQPSELLGLYGYVKKVSVAVDQCGSRDNIDGSTLLRTLPSSVPKSLDGTHAADQWYVAGKAAGDDLRDTQRSAFSLGSSVSSSRRNTYYTTTVSAGNAIHFSCHQRARQADRNHPKAPKSEWEGAALRNSRVNCNVILPLVSSRSSDVPLVAVDSALTEYQTAVNNLTGNAAKFSMLWTVLHDVRFLLLRMAHGELLNTDCGGGSLFSNAQLLIHQMMMADMFEKDAQVDSPETAQHVRNLSAGFLAAGSIVHASDYNKSGPSTSSVLTRGIADAAPMAGLTCILTRNTKDDYGSGAESSDSKPHPKRRWKEGAEQFLRGLVICAGRRHALGIETSGCISGRGGTTSSSGGRGRSSSFADWDSSETEDATSSGSAAASGAGRKGKKRSLKPDIDDFGTSLRPMMTLYAILDQLSESFVLNMKDPEIEETADKIVKVLEKCHKAKGIRELLETCNATFLDEDEILDDFQRGMISA